MSSMTVPRLISIIALALVVAGGSRASAQEHPPARQEHAPVPQTTPVPQGAQPAHPEATAHATEEHDTHGSSLVTMAARLLNFGILVGALVYFLRSPFALYLASRSAQIRQDLVSAEEMRTTATSELAEIGARMQALPAELEALRRQGAEDVQSEQARISRAAADERTRLLEQTRREIDTRLRVARRELTEHAAHLAVGVAEQRIRRTITPDDQIRLLDRYASQLQEVR